MQLLKIGGNEIAEPAFLPALAAFIADLSEPAIIVHGGGRAIADLQQKMGLQPAKVDGLRVTDEDSLAAVQMVLSGDINKRIVAALLAAGADAAGVSGVDGGLLRCIKKPHPKADLGLVGEIRQVRSKLLLALLENGVTPVVSPISLGLDGRIYNVNADEAASALAAAMQAKLLTFVSNVPGVLDPTGRLFPSLSKAEAEALIDCGVISGGMIPKTQAALNALAAGIPQVRITNLAGLTSASGTIFSAEGNDTPPAHTLIPEGQKPETREPENPTT